MFRTKTVRTIDRTGFISLTTDGVTDRSTRRWTPQCSDAKETTYGVRTGRTLFVSTALSPGIHGKNAASIATTSVSNEHSSLIQRHFRANQWARALKVAGTRIVNITATIRAVIDVTTLCTPSLAVTRTAGHEFPRVRLASPCPSGPGIYNPRRFGPWPFFSLGSC
jgi:hypothetical protein